MLRFIALAAVRVVRTWHIYNTNIIYSVEFLLQLENKQQIMQNNMETQQKHMYLLYIGNLCNIALSVARFTCIVTSQVNAMKQSIEICLL